MNGHVNTTGSVFYGHNCSPSILGLQVIDHNRLDIMWILFVPSAMMQHESITAQKFLDSPYRSKNLKLIKSFTAFIFGLELCYLVIEKHGCWLV